MRLIDDVKDAPKFWSIRLAIVSAALSAMEAAMPLFRDDISSGVFASVAALVAVSAAVARTIKQETLK